MEIYPKSFTMKEFLVFLVAAAIHATIFAILDYGYGIRFGPDLMLVLLKWAILFFLIYPLVRIVYIHFNLGRFLK